MENGATQSQACRLERILELELSTSPVYRQPTENGFPSLTLSFLLSTFVLFDSRQQSFTSGKKRDGCRCVTGLYAPDAAHPQLF